MFKHGRFKVASIIPDTLVVDKMGYMSTMLALTWWHPELVVSSSYLQFTVLDVCLVFYNDMMYPCTCILILDPFLPIPHVQKYEQR